MKRTIGRNRWFTEEPVEKDPKGRCTSHRVYTYMMKYCGSYGWAVHNIRRKKYYGRRLNKPDDGIPKIHIHDIMTGTLITMTIPEKVGELPTVLRISDTITDDKLKALTDFILKNNDLLLMAYYEDSFIYDIIPEPYVDDVMCRYLIQTMHVPQIAANKDIRLQDFINRFGLENIMLSNTIPEKYRRLRYNFSEEIKDKKEG